MFNSCILVIKLRTMKFVVPHKSIKIIVFVIVPPSCYERNDGVYDLLPTCLRISEGQYNHSLNFFFFFRYFVSEKANHCPLQEKLAAYFLSKMDSDNPKVQEVSYILLWN